MAFRVYLTPQLSTFRNRPVTHNLNLQLEILANATHLGLVEINEKVQATAKTTLQNRLALDLLLLQEVRACLNLNNSCVRIPNVTV